MSGVISGETPVSPVDIYSIQRKWNDKKNRFYRCWPYCTLYAHGVCPDRKSLWIHTGRTLLKTWLIHDYPEYLLHNHDPPPATSVYIPELIYDDSDTQIPAFDYW